MTPSTATQQPTPEQVAADEKRRSAFVRGLRELADAMEQNHAIPVPWGTQVNTFVDTREEAATVARAGSWRKVYAGDWFSLRREFSGEVVLDVNIQRAQVCERVVVGTETVPAQPAHEVEIVEWRCADSLLAPEAA